MITTTSYTDAERLRLRELYIGNETDTDEYRETQPAKGLDLVAALATHYQHRHPGDLAEVIELAVDWLQAVRDGYRNSAGPYAGAEELAALCGMDFDLLWSRGDHPYYDTDREVRETLDDLG